MTKQEALDLKAQIEKENHQGITLGKVTYRKRGWHVHWVCSSYAASEDGTFTGFAVPTPQAWEDWKQHYLKERKQV